MLCERCGERPATQISTQIVDGEKRARYRCDVCAELQDETAQVRLERPCEQCGEREGRIKLIRLREQRRVVSFICEVCAGQR